MSELTARLRLTADGREFIQMLERAGVKVNDLGQKAQSQSGGMRSLSAASDSVSGSLQGMTARLGPAGAALSALGPAGLAAGAGIAALTLGLQQSLSAAAEAEKIELRLGAVLEATGNAAGLTKKEIVDFANDMQKNLRINDEAIKESAAVLATFRAVSGDTFKEAIVLAADMTTIFGGDLVSASRQLGLALQDPATGMTALRRAGVTFTESQKELVLSLAATGDIAGAQAVIMEELRNQISGAAVAEGAGLTGATNRLSNAWDDLLETIGRTGPVSQGAKGGLDLLSSSLDLLERQIGGLDIDEKILEITGKIEAAQKGLLALESGERRPLLGRDFFIDDYKKVIVAREQELSLLQQIKSFSDVLNLEEKSAAEASAIATKAGIALEASGNKLKEEGAKAEKTAATDAKKAAEDRVKQIEAGYQARRKVNELVRKGREDELKLDQARAKALEEVITGMETEARLSGVSADVRRELVAIENARKAAGLAANEALAAGDAARIRAALAVQSANEAALKQQEEIAATARRMADDVAGFLVDGFVDAAQGGESAFEDMWDAALAGGKRFLANIAAEILKQNFILPITTAIVGAAPGLFGAGGSASGGGELGTAANGASLGNFLSGGRLSSSISAKLFGTGAVGAAGPQVPTAGILGSGGIAGTAGTIATGAGLAIAALGIARAAGFISPKPTVGANAGGRLDEAGGRFFITGVGEDRNKGVSQLAAVQSVLDGALLAINSFVDGAGLLDQQIGDGVREAVQLFASGKNPINITVESLTKAMIPYVEGLNDAQRATIAAAQGLDGLQQVMEEIAAQNALPGLIADRLLAAEDPAAAQRKILDAEFDGLRARVAAVRDNGVTLANVEKLYQIGLREIETRFASGAGKAISTALEDALTVQSIAFGRVEDAARVLNKSVQAERDALTQSFTAQARVSQDALTRVNDTVTRLSQLSQALKSALGGLEQPGGLGASRIAAQRQISEALLAARNGGVLPDEEALRDALSVVQKPSEGLFETFTDYQRDFVKTRNDISELSGYAGWQLAKAESQAQLLQRQIDQDRAGYDAGIVRLDGVLLAAQAQIDEVKGTTIAVKSVEDAVRALALALASAQTARAGAQAADPVNSLFGALLGRQADAGGAAHFNDALAAGQSTGDVAQNIIRSPEFGAVAQGGGIAGLYGTLLGRAPDASGLAYWNAQLAAGQSLQEIALNITRGQEYADLVKVRGFAHGGAVRPGETILLGEQGQEFFTAGPTGGFVTNNAGTQRALDNRDVVAELGKLGRAMAQLERQMRDTARHSERTASLLYSVTQDGQSLMTKAVA